MSSFDLTVIILILCITIARITDRIWTGKEHIAEAQFGKKEEKKDRNQIGFAGKS